MSNRGRLGGLNSDCRDQPRVGGFAFFMVTTRADRGDPIGFGGRRFSAYLRRKDRTNSFVNRESSSFLIITHVWKHNEASESGLTTTPSARKPRAVGFVRMATPTCSDTR